MIAIPLLAVLLLGSPQDSAVVAAPQVSASQDSSTSASPAAVAAPRRFTSQLTPEQQEQIKQKQEEFRIQHEPERQTAIRLNDLAGSIHSEADARKLVDAVAEELTHHRHLLWAGLTIRRSVAHAEYEAVSNPSGLIPEQRIVDVWNEYVREIDAPEEALVTVAELHNLRDSMYVGASRLSWKNDLAQSVWTMPNIYALDADGKISDGCRALEALKIIHDMHDSFMNVRIARARTQKGVLASAVLAQREQASSQAPTRIFASGQLRILTSNPDPIRPAVFRYQQEHGMDSYNQLVRRLFAELLPAE